MTEDLICPMCRFRFGTPSHEYGCPIGRGLIKDPSEVVTMIQFGELARWTYATTRSYRSRGELPDEDFLMGNKPLWLREKVIEWLKKKEPIVHVRD